MSNSPARSRLSRFEEKQNLKKAYLLIGLSVFIIGGLAIFGLPLMIKAATLLGELRSSGEAIARKDQIPPQAPILDSFSSFTNSKKVDLFGKTEAGVAVITKINGLNGQETISDAGGKFSLTITLKEGENEISIIAKDVAGNESEPKQLTITYDDLPPKIEITNPAESNSTTEENKINVIGKTEPKAQVYLNDRRIIVNQDGSFQSLYYLQEGENTIKIVAKDHAGNETELGLIVRYERF